MQLSNHRLPFLALLAGMLALIPPVDAKNKKVQAAPKDPQDEIEVVGRGLILVAIPEGIWILQRRFAEDPEVDKAYAHQVVYQ